jgi:DNA polymerase-3 subunit beta
METTEHDFKNKMKVLDFKNKLAKLSKVIDNKNTLPVLDNVKIENSTLTVSDLETFYSIKDLDIPSSITCLVDFKSLKNIFQKLNKNIDVELFQDNSQLQIITKVGTLRLPAITKGDELFEYYPERDSIVNDFKTGTIGYDSIKLMKKAVKYTINDEIRPVLRGVYLDNDNKSIVATNSHKMCFYSKPEDADFGINSITPTKPISILDDKYVYSIKVDEKNIEFHGSNDEIISVRKIDANYPLWKHVIPVNNDKSLNIKGNDLQEMLEIALLSSNQTSFLGKFKMSENGCKLLSQDIDTGTSYSGDMGCEYQGETMEIGFNIKALLDILKNEKYKNIEFQFSEPNRPFILNNEILLMPLNLKKQSNLLIQNQNYGNNN